MKRRIAKFLSFTLVFTTVVIPNYASNSFIATATPNSENNCVMLSWNVPDSTAAHSYMVYQWHEGDEDYQSIPAKDEVKVLEVYPYQSGLKGWVEAYGQGKITCDSISIDEFNMKSSIMWDYDVIVFGFWDYNNRLDLNETSRQQVEEYIKSGRGVLFGHDTVYENNTQFALLAPYVNLTLDGTLSINDDKINITKKGLLTNYPYHIGEIGTELTIPISHSTKQIAHGDIWMRFEKDDSFYLTTWNNCAMIQTGHSKGAATEDEQKLLMNTIFYLAQITEKTSAELHIGQDLTGPTLPICTGSNIDYANGTINLALTSEDQGDTYNYYVEATNLKTDEKQKSNTVTTEVVTGLKGYSIVTDNNPATVPDDTIEVTNGNYETTFDKTKATYIHVKAIDNVGNASEVLHFEVKDSIAPTMPSIKEIRNEKDEFNTKLVLVQGEDYESGIARHEYRLNNDEWQEWKENLEFKSLVDGNYILEVRAVDNAGNDSIINKLEFKNVYHQIQEAIEAVDKAEETFTIEDYEHARELVDALDESDIKDELTERLDMMKEILEEEILMQELKEIKKGVSDDNISEEEFDKLVERFEIAKEKVKGVEDPYTKKRMQKLVDEIEAIIAAKKHHLTEKTFNLTAVPQIETNNVALDWHTDINLLDYTYRIFASHNGSQVQSIPAKNEVKVLEVYPSRSYLPKWIDSYDTVGKLTCNAVSIEQFNENPEMAWNYDVVVLGFADSYNRKDLIKTSADELKTYIESGKSVLFSHNTLSNYYPRPNLTSLASYLKIQTTSNNSMKAVSKAYITQNGGLINYPYAVGKLDEEVIVPPTHAYEVATGDVWVKLGDNDQFYLTTWNNCAMIQTGHDPRTTNEVEQKLLLNTLYYLGQITEATTRVDYMGQDIDAPTMPEMLDIQTETANAKLSFNLVSEDQGTDYSYYVEATCLKDQSKVQSTTASALMLSGLEGYSIVIDEAENTIPDDVIDITDNAYEVDVDFSKPFYVHVKAIDKVGNSSAVKHYYYTDTVAPTTPSLKVEEDILKLVPGEDYGFGIATHLYSVNGEAWKEWNGDINLLELEDGVYTFAIKAIDKAQHESEVYTYTANVSYHQDAVNILLDKLQECKVVFENYEITQDEFEETLSIFEALQEQASSIEDIDNKLDDSISEIKVVLEQREAAAEADSAKAVQYLRLAEKYQKESYIEKAKSYVEDLIASIFRSNLMQRLEELMASIGMEETIEVENEQSNEQSQIESQVILVEEIETVYEEEETIYCEEQQNSTEQVEEATTQEEIESSQE